MRGWAVSVLKPWQGRFPRDAARRRPSTFARGARDSRRRWLVDRCRAPADTKRRGVPPLRAPTCRLLMAAEPGSSAHLPARCQTGFRRHFHVFVVRPVADHSPAAFPASSAWMGEGPSPSRAVAGEAQRRYRPEAKRPTSEMVSDLRELWSGCRDLNPGPQRPERCALTKLRYIPWEGASLALADFTLLSGIGRDSSGGSSLGDQAVDAPAERARVDRLHQLGVGVGALGEEAVGLPVEQQQDRRVGQAARRRLRAGGRSRPRSPPMLPICMSRITTSGSYSVSTVLRTSWPRGDLDDALAGADARRLHQVADPLGFGRDEDGLTAGNASPSRAPSIAESATPGTRLRDGRDQATRQRADGVRARRSRTRRGRARARARRRRCRCGPRAPCELAALALGDLVRSRRGWRSGRRAIAAAAPPSRLAARAATPRCAQSGRVARTEVRVHPVHDRARRREAVLAEPLGEVLRLLHRVAARRRDEHERGRSGTPSSSITSLRPVAEPLLHALRTRWKNATTSSTTSAPTTREIVRRNACAAHRRRAAPVRVGTISEPEDAVVEQAGEPARRVEEVERVPGGRRVDDDEVEPALLVQLVAASPSPCTPACPTARRRCCGRSGSRGCAAPAPSIAAYCVTSSSNVDFVSSIIAEKRAAGARGRPSGPTASVGISRGSFDSSSSPSVLARRLAGSMVTTTRVAAAPARASIASTAGGRRLADATACRSRRRRDRARRRRRAVAACWHRQAFDTRR